MNAAAAMSGRIRAALPSCDRAMTDLSEERLAHLIASLPPAPAAWTAAASELPRARAAIDELAARATADAEARRLILADLAVALRDAGVEPHPPLIEHLRSRLADAPQ